MPSHISLVAPLRPAWPSCMQNLVFDCACTKSTMRFQAASCASLYMPAQPGEMRASRRHVGHLGEHQAGAADGARAVMHEMPVGGHAVLRRVLAHRRDHDAVLERHAAQTERLEHRRQRLRRHRQAKPSARTSRATTWSACSTKCGRAQRQVVVGDRLGARHQAEGEAGRVHVPEALDVLEPDQRDVGRVLGLLHLVAPLGLEVRERGGDVAAAGRPEGLVERDRVLHRELGAGADGEMRGRLGVADQHDVVGDPALAADGRESCARSSGW